MKPDWIAKLQHLLQTIAFALAIATIQYAFLPDRLYAPLVTYSLAIATMTWAIIDLGRDLFPSARETGWPTGPSGLLLVVVGIVAGYLLGNALADMACRSFGWHQGGPPVNRENELRNSILITALAGITGTYYFYSRNKNFYLERRMTEAHTQASEARLKLLETQLEPHMLFNTLANLRALIGIDPPRAQHMLDHMIAYLRATLSASRASTHTLQAEFDRLRDYLELMAVRMGPRLAYQLDLPAELAALPVPTLLLQPLVENCIKHGLEPKVEGGGITVQASLSGDVLTLDVMDTGVGLVAHPLVDAHARSDGSPLGGDPVDGGFGLAQVRERLTTVYGPQATIKIVANSPHGTRAIITFPCKSNAA
jgi:signal transduction histidine kinase